METDQLSETLTKLNNSLDPKVVSKKSNSEMLLQLEVLSWRLLQRHKHEKNQLAASV